VAPFAARAGFGHTSLVHFVFGAATVVGIWVVGVRADRDLRPTLVAALGLVAVVMLMLGLPAHVPAVLLIAVTLWGAAFGGAPTLIQTALVSASGPALRFPVPPPSERPVQTFRPERNPFYHDCHGEPGRRVWNRLSWTALSRRSIAGCKHAFPMGRYGGPCCSSRATTL
jgi:hypothetical protein